MRTTTILLIGFLLVFTSCLPANDSADTIEIGVITALSGENSVQGEWMSRGLEIAKDHINAAGGVHGRELVLLYEDSQFQAAKALSAAQKLVEKDGVSSFITLSGASSTLAIAPYATSKHVVHMEVLCIVRACQTKNDMLFRISGPPDDQLRHIVDYLEETDIETASVLYINNDYGAYQHELFLELFPGVVLSAEAFDQGEIDLRTQILKVAKLNPDVILLLSFPHETSRFLKQQGELELTIPTVGTVTSENKRTLTVAGEHAEGHVYSYFATNFAEGLGKKYYEEYVSRHGEEPEMFGAKSYDALLVLKTAMEQCDDPNDSLCVAEKIVGLKDLQGVSDVLTFDIHGDLAHERFEMKQIVNGEFVKLED